MKNNIYIYILISAVISTLIRVLPTTLIRRQITNKFIRSFLYYVPYVTLSVMTFPAIIEATDSPVSGVLALITGIAAAWFNMGLFKVAVLCCIVAFLSGMII